MHVLKRNGNLEPVNLQKIVNSITKICTGIDIDLYSIAVKTVSGLYDGVPTRQLDELSIQAAVGFILDDPTYSKVAARLLANLISKEVVNQEIATFSQSIKYGYDNKRIGDETYKLVNQNKRKLNEAIKHDRDRLFEYYGLSTVYSRYLLKHPVTRKVIETPQYFFMRVACGVSNTVQEAIEFYDLLSSLKYMTSSPTLFNSGTKHQQLSSCFLLSSPMDDLKNILKTNQDVGLLSKWAGGIGLSYSNVRSSGDLINGTNGMSNGIIPFLHTLSAQVGCIDQGGRRKGAACVYLEPHHPDIMEFLALRDNVGDKEKRAYNLNLANWIPDIFMKRVQESITTKKDIMWSLISPAIAPDLSNLFGDEYTKRYEELEASGSYTSQLPVLKVFSRMMRTLSETGNGWMCFKDMSNLKCNTATNGNSVKSSNLCTEIILPASSGTYIRIKTSDFKKYKEDYKIKVIDYDHNTDEFICINAGEIAVCNLGSINVGAHLKENNDGKYEVDYDSIRHTVRLAIPRLDRVVDRNFYPVQEAEASNKRFRPVGLGVMGLADVFFQLRIPFESLEAVEISKRISEVIYHEALSVSCELAELYGPHSDFEYTHAAKGLLQHDLWEGTITTIDWEPLRQRIATHGLRNSMLIAIAPTVTISAIAGAEECIEPQKSNIFKAETLSGEFTRINKFLVSDLKSLGLWNKKIIDQIIEHDGSVQSIQEIPDSIKVLYKSVWEMKQRWLIDHAAARGPFIDQSQSLNLFIEEPSLDTLTSAYIYLWQKKLKTSYYLRSRNKSKIKKAASGDYNTAEVIKETPPMAPEHIDICESCT